MSSKTKKERKVKTNNTTRKAWKKDATHTAFKINNVHILDKNDDKRVRMEQLKPGVTKFLPENKPGDVRRLWPKGKDNWKKEDVIKFDYLLNKYKKKGNYKLTPEDEVNINKLLKSKGIREDENTPTPPEETKKEIEKQEKQREKKSKPEKEPEPEPEPEAKLQIEVTEKKELESSDDDLDLDNEVTVIQNIESDETCKQLLEGKKNNIQNKNIRRKVLKCL